MKNILLSSYSFDVAFDFIVLPYVMALLLTAPSGVLADEKAPHGVLATQKARKAPPATGKFNGTDVSKSAAHFSGKPRPEHTARPKKPVAATTTSRGRALPAVCFLLSRWRFKPSLRMSRRDGGPRVIGREREIY